MNMRNSIFLNQLEFHVDCFVHYFLCFVQTVECTLHFTNVPRLAEKDKHQKWFFCLVFFWYHFWCSLCPVRTDFCRNPYYNCDFPGVNCSICRPTPLIWGCFHGNLRVPPNGPPKKEGLLQGLSTIIWSLNKALWGLCFFWDGKHGLDVPLEVSKKVGISGLCHPNSSPISRWNSPCDPDHWS